MLYSADNIPTKGDSHEIVFVLANLQNKTREKARRPLYFTVLCNALATYFRERIEGPCFFSLPREKIPPPGLEPGSFG